MSGPTGLDYSGVRAAFDLLGVEQTGRTEMFELVQCMESAALDEWAKPAT